MKFSSLFIFFLIANIINAQVKDEKETRIKPNEFPRIALEFLNQLPENTKRIKYYKETDGNTSSFEAKFKLKKLRYSIEFSIDGILEDIEVIQQFKKLDNGLTKTMTNHFKNNYSKYKLIKVQKQYKNVSDKNLNQLLKKALNNAFHDAIFYEIIAEVTSNKKREIREFTFDKKGNYISSRGLKPSSYEHVLY